jgi:hypothetical protein
VGRVPRRDPTKLKLAMLTAYFDESGTASSEKLCMVAGFVGNDAQWASFAHDWIPALGHHRKNLHLTKLRWNQRYDQIVSDLARLGPIPHRYNLAPVRVGMWHQDFEELMKGKINETYANPYITCAIASISTVMEEVAGPTDEVMFIFDRQEGRRAHAMERLYKIVFKLSKLDRRVVDIVFRSRHSTVCLDPADFLAFEAREYAVNKESKKAKAALPIVLAEKGYGGILERDQVKYIADRYIASGLVPGGKKKMSNELMSALLKAGWDEIGIRKLRTMVEGAADNLHFLE